MVWCEISAVCRGPVTKSTLRQKVLLIFRSPSGADLTPDVIRKLATGDAQDLKPPAGAFFCETWGRTLIVKRETEHEADFVDLEPELLFNSNLRLQMFVDQTKGRLIVLSDSRQVAGRIDRARQQTAFRQRDLVDEQVGHFKVEFTAGQPLEWRRSPAGGN